MIALALYLLRCRVTHTAISEATELLTVAFALKVGSMHCLLILSLQALSHRIPKSRHQRGSCIAQPFSGYQPMHRTEFAMSTANTKKIIAVHTETARAAVREIILTQRFICHFDAAGRLQMTELRAGGIYLEACEIPDAIASGALPLAMVELIADAAALAMSLKS